MRRFYAPNAIFDTPNITLNFEETKHLRDVLRLREAGKIHVFNGNGKEFLCVIKQISKRETALEILEEILPTAPESNLDLTLAVALLKGETFDLIIQKAVELGVKKFVPLNTKRSEIKIKDGEKKVERWRKIVVEATKQCGRAKLMEFQPPIDFDKFIAAADGTKIMFAEKSGKGFPVNKNSAKIVAVIGAKGGWEDAEIEAAREKDFQVVTFGGRILRVETAAISFAAILQHKFGDFV